ncbi:PREDICTED: probable leucine-rich repeat receptor-like serine/threonine-protein kinase At5g15730 [Fragaria vesca subsp. vesca]|uniref:probable leucine-rich repeat receptor-like serine/threonine-protein kinase At5g15730 n=1 Tax=Fragaria vesca subsp. vesca TaxID=101020 RepID=UPI0002C2E4D1|nr:PREDICTED: probable leucine-rich repeat receptor-like serine/threonine-protein kinase At5g15730 [Fragaria vesca subsp. vesca]
MEGLEVAWGILIGSVIGFLLAATLVIGALVCRKYRAKLRTGTSVSASQRITAASAAESDSNLGRDSPRSSEWSNMSMWLEALKKKNVVSACGIPKYSYGDIKKATCDFTTAIGHGAFGPVYKAQMSTGETFAVKVLASDSRQGQHEFLAEVLLLARLHHNNLVSLMGYTAEMDQLMLLYNYMSSGSLDSHLHADNQVPLSWDLRVAIALDVARGLEYLHYGAVPPVVHRDIKSSNILLDQSMKAKIADFGLSRQDKMKSRSSGIRGTLGYVDPEYVVTRIFTKKCDVYSFGVLLFELITGRNPQQGLMEYVEFATMDAADSLAWEEIVDLRLNGEFDVQELAQVADLAYKCVGNVSRKRPSMRDIVQTLSVILMKRRSAKKHQHTPTAAAEETYIEIELIEKQDHLIER